MHLEAPVTTPTSAELHFHRWEVSVLLGNLRRAVALLQRHSIQNQLRSRLLAWRDWAERRRYLARSVADRLQGRYLGSVWQAWRQYVQLAKLGRSQGLFAMAHFTSRTSAQVSKIAAKFAGIQSQKVLIWMP